MKKESLGNRHANNNSASRVTLRKRVDFFLPTGIFAYREASLGYQSSTGAGHSRDSECNFFQPGCRLAPMDAIRTRSRRHPPRGLADKMAWR